MKEYKEKPIGWLWYVILFLVICLSLADYISWSFFSVCLLFFGVRLLIYLLKRYNANNTIDDISVALYNAKNIHDLENLISIILKEKVRLRIFLLNMIANRAETIVVESVYPKTVIAKKRACYYVVYISIVKKKKVNQVVYYDLNNVEDATLYIFENAVEWTGNNNHRSIALLNIIDMDIDNNGTILNILKRGEGGTINFYTPNAILVMEIIKRLQHKQL